jgi:hypothetical protein
MGYAHERGNRKSQVPKPKEAPNPKQQWEHERIFGIWCLVLLWGLVLGTWNLGK